MVSIMVALKEIEKTVLGLPVEQRVALAETLLDSLPPVTDADSESDELAEGERRDREIESGQVQPLSEAEFWNRIETHRER